MKLTEGKNPLWWLHSKSVAQLEFTSMISGMQPFLLLLLCGSIPSEGSTYITGSHGLACKWLLMTRQLRAHHLCEG